MTRKHPYSASDLITYWRSAFAFQMERLAEADRDLLALKNVEDDLSRVLRSKGQAHEDTLIQHFAQQGLRISSVDRHRDSYTQTIQAMERGDDVIAQAHLSDGALGGYADFLVKGDGKSRFGDYCYEVWEAKLASEVKSEFVLQAIFYSDLLAHYQKCMPSHAVIALGNGEQERFRLQDYAATFYAVKNRFLQSVQELPSSPVDPLNSREWGDWSDYAEKILQERDHVWQVADITRTQIKKLHRAGIETLTELAEAKSDSAIGINDKVFNRLQAQAKIQRDGHGRMPPLYAILPPPEGARQGLSLLPPESRSDIFFDIEGYPLMEGGLEYLWGCSYFDEHGKRQYRDFWAHDRNQERQAFSSFIDWAYQRWVKDPNMHIYHYANYEIAACRRLMGRFGICEWEVDELLRHNVFIDLYKVVKTGLLLGESGYSIKNVEHLYRGVRDTAVGSGGDSVLAYEVWRDAHFAGEQGDTWQTAPILRDLRDYNIDDCDSTQELVAWLREQQRQHDIAYLPPAEKNDAEPLEKDTPQTALKEKLLQTADLAATTDADWAQVLRNVAGFIEFHRRENKPVFWRLYDRLAQEPSQLLADLDCLAFCRRRPTEPYKLTSRSKNLVYIYDFDESQEFKGAYKQFYVLDEYTTDGRPLKVTWVESESDLSSGMIALSAKEAPPDEISLLPDEFINPDPIPRAIEHLAHDLTVSRPPDSAIWDVLLRNKPRFRQPRTGAIVGGQNPAERLHSIVEAIANLHNSYLVVQGPPGTGKSYTAKHVIAALLRGGAKIGITSNSHKAINHLLLACAKFCRQQSIASEFFCTKETSSKLIDCGVQVIQNRDIAAVSGEVCVVGTTAWGFCRPELQQQFDYLFVDEAGQVSLANLFAMSDAADNLVLLGDQMQLGQPVQGEHPEQSGWSVLDYLLHEEPTVAEDAGVFLPVTFRMHSAVSRVISQHFYDSKLHSDPSTDDRYLILPPSQMLYIDRPAGIRFVACEHEGNTQASVEEIEVIKACVDELLQCEYQQASGDVRQLTLQDMLFVAPYNHQVKKLKDALGGDALVGSVDKFQGQEAPIVFFSFCSSNVEDSPRGMTFLFDPHRINVAISRAQTLAVIVGHPHLALHRPQSLQQLKLMSLYNSFLEPPFS